MKVTLSIITLVLTAATLQADGDYLNFLIQTQGNSAQTTHKMDDIDAVGDAQALEGVDVSSVFRLWTINRSTGAEHLLDEKMVSAYHPQAEITITSDDPYTGIPRTRSDHPFKLSYKIEGLLPNDPEAPAAAKSVILQHKVTKYGRDKHHKDSTATTTESQTSETSNGTVGPVETYTSIPSPGDLTQANGEEEFIIWTLPDGVVTDYTILDQQKVQVWPVASAVIKPYGGEDASTTENRLSVELTDLYPESTTYVRITSDDPTSPSARFTKVSGSTVIINDSTPQDRDFSLLNLDQHMPEGGTYVVQIIHETPFGAEILAAHNLTKRTEIKINGHLTDAE